MHLHGKIIVIKRNGGDGAHFPLTANSCLFGRGLDCDIRIQLSTVDVKQCQIEIDSKGHVFLKDLSSSSSTLVNDVPLSASLTALAHGDVITIADRKFRFEFPTSSRFYPNKLPVSPKTPINLDSPMTKLSTSVGKTPATSAVKPLSPRTDNVPTSAKSRGPAQVSDESRRRDTSPDFLFGLSPTSFYKTSVSPRALRKLSDIQQGKKSPIPKLTPATFAQGTSSQTISPGKKNPGTPYSKANSNLRKSISDLRRRSMPVFELEENSPQTLDTTLEQNVQQNNVSQEGTKRKSPGFTLPNAKRKRVSFGPSLSPEHFDKTLPPKTPIKKGATPGRPDHERRKSLLKRKSPKTSPAVKKTPPPKSPHISKVLSSKATGSFQPETPDVSSPTAQPVNAEGEKLSLRSRSPINLLQQVRSPRKSPKFQATSKISPKKSPSRSPSPAKKKSPIRNQSPQEETSQPTISKTSNVKSPNKSLGSYPFENSLGPSFSESNTNGKEQLFNTPRLNKKSLKLSSKETPGAIASAVSLLKKRARSGDQLLSPKTFVARTRSLSPKQLAKSIPAPEKRVKTPPKSASPLNETPKSSKKGLKSPTVIKFPEDSLLPSQDLFSQVAPVQNETQHNVRKQINTYTNSRATSVSPTGMTRIFRTPAQKSNSFTEISPSGLKRLMKTPKERKPESKVSPSGLTHLRKTSKEKKTVSPSGVKRLVKTPRVKRNAPSLNSPTGLRRLMITPKQKHVTDISFTGIEELLKSPASEGAENGGKNMNHNNSQEFFVTNVQSKDTPGPEISLKRTRTPKKFFDEVQSLSVNSPTSRYLNSASAYRSGISSVTNTELENSYKPVTPSRTFIAPGKMPKSTTPISVVNPNRTEKSLNQITPDSAKKTSQTQTAKSNSPSELVSNPTEKIVSPPQDINKVVALRAIHGHTVTPKLALLRKAATPRRMSRPVAHKTPKIKTWSDIVKSGAQISKPVLVTKPVAPAKGVVLKKPSPVKRAGKTPKTPRALIRALAPTTGHAESPATIIVGKKVAAARMKTPKLFPRKGRKQPLSKLSMKSAGNTSFSGLTELFSTPKASTPQVEMNESALYADIPDTPNGPNEMFVSPLTNRKSSVGSRKSIMLVGVRGLFQHKKHQSEIKLTGLRELFAPSKSQTEVSPTGVKRLMATPKVKTLTSSPMGVKRLITTPKVKALPSSPTGVKRLVATPKTKVLTSPTGVENLFKTPENKTKVLTSSPTGVESLFKTPENNTPGITKEEKFSNAEPQAKGKKFPVETEEEISAKKAKLSSSNQNVSEASALPVKRTRRGKGSPVKQSPTKVKARAKGTRGKKNKAEIVPEVSEVASSPAAPVENIAESAPLAVEKRGRKNVAEAHLNVTESVALLTESSQSGRRTAKGRRQQKKSPLKNVQESSVIPDIPLRKGRSKIGSVSELASTEPAIGTNVASVKPVPTSRSRKAKTSSTPVKPVASQRGKANMTVQPSETDQKPASVKSVPTARSRKAKTSSTPVKPVASQRGKANMTVQPSETDQEPAMSRARKGKAKATTLAPVHLTPSAPKPAARRGRTKTPPPPLSVEPALATSQPLQPFITKTDRGKAKTTTQSLTTSPVEPAMATTQSAVPSPTKTAITSQGKAKTAARVLTGSPAKLTARRMRGTKNSTVPSTPSPAKPKATRQGRKTLKVSFETQQPVMTVVQEPVVSTDVTDKSKAAGKCKADQTEASAMPKNITFSNPETARHSKTMKATLEKTALHSRSSTRAKKSQAVNEDVEEVVEAVSTEDKSRSRLSKTQTKPAVAASAAKPTTRRAKADLSSPTKSTPIKSKETKTEEATKRRGGRKTTKAMSSAKAVTDQKKKPASNHSPVKLTRGKSKTAKAVSASPIVTRTRR